MTGNQDGWLDEPGLLTGAAGIALALLAATTPDRARLGPHVAGVDPAGPVAS